jgi:hypothetical protein
VLVCLVLQRFLEMGAPIQRFRRPPRAALADPRGASPGSEPARIVAAGKVFRPNGSALDGLEDVRGYESLVLDRFADTYPLWCEAQPASFNRVDDVTRPFVAFLNARFAIAEPEAPVPAGWLEKGRGAEMAVFENPRALPRGFVPARLRREPDPKRRLASMAEETDFRRRPGSRARVRRSKTTARRRSPCARSGRTSFSKRTSCAGPSSRRPCRTGRDGTPSRPVGQSRSSPPTTPSSVSGCRPAATRSASLIGLSWSLGLWSLLAGAIACVVLASGRRPRDGPAVVALLAGYALCRALWCNRLPSLLGGCAWALSGAVALDGDRRRATRRGGEARFSGHPAVTLGENPM